MGLFTKDIKTMDDLFTHTLRDIPRRCRFFARPS